MRDSDPKNEIDQVESPEHRSADPRHADAAVELIPPRNQTPQRDKAQRQQHRQVAPTHSLQRPPKVFSYVVHATWLSRDKTPSASFPVLREAASPVRSLQAARRGSPDRSNLRTPSLPRDTIAHTPAGY